MSNYLISQTGQKDIIKEADLLLDMMEYKAAIFYYEKYVYLGGKEEVEVKELLKSLK